MRIWSLIGSTRAVRFVELAAQAFVVRVAHDRVVAWKLEGQHPSVYAFPLGGIGGERQGRRGEATKLLHIADMFFPSLRCVQDVFRERRLQLRQAFAQLLESRFLARRQIDAGEAEVAHGVCQNLFL